MTVKNLVQRSLLFYAGIVFICFAIFPIVFLYGFSLLIEQFVGADTKAAIEHAWDLIGKPYEYLTRVSK